VTAASKKQSVPMLADVIIGFAVIDAHVAAVNDKHNDEIQAIRVIIWIGRKISRSNYVSLQVV
jgi:hypothetical protein